MRSIGNINTPITSALNAANVNQQQQLMSQNVTRGGNTSSMVRTYIGDPVSQGFKSIPNSVLRYRQAESRGTFADIPMKPQNNRIRTNITNNNMIGRNSTNVNQLQSTAINPKAFNTTVAGQLFNQNYVDPSLSANTPLTQKQNTPLKQVMDNSNMDPLTGQYIDPTLSQGTNPGTVNPMEVQNLQASTQY